MNKFVGIACLIGIILISSYQNVMVANHLTTVNSRKTAKIWIDRNLEPDSKFAIESYSPFVDPDIFNVHSVGRIIDNTPNWHIDENFDYLVFSQGIYGRFYRENVKYEDEVLLYDQFFDQVELVKLFTDGDYEIQVYKVR